MSAGTIFDDDLTQALDDLRYVASRLLLLDQQIAELDETKHYDRWTAIRVERGDLQEQLSIRAERMKVSARALLRLVDQANRMRSPRRRAAPSLNALRSAMEIVNEATERQRIDAIANAKMARFIAKTISEFHSDGVDALAYLDASAA